MKVGFTGTRNGMTPEQRKSFCRLICELPSFTEFHHGDCVGADDEAADAVHGVRGAGDLCRGFKVVCHPPLDGSYRSNNSHHDEIREPTTHFARNRVIVDETDLLVACPPAEPLPECGGTSYTVNFALKVGKPVKVVWPDGRVEDLGRATASH